MKAAIIILVYVCIILKASSQPPAPDIILIDRIAVDGTALIERNLVGTIRQGNIIRYYDKRDSTYLHTYCHLIDPIAISTKSSDMNTREKGMFSNGYKAGKWVLEYCLNEDCVKHISWYNKGILSGWYTIQDKNKKVLYRSLFVNGTGKIETLHPNKLIKSEGLYRNNVMHGLWKHYDTNGKLEKEEYYKQGKIVQTKYY